jgi:biotin transport system substrate-specific component
MIAASIVIYAFGVAGLMLTLGVGLGRAIGLGVVPFLVGDAIKSVLAAAALPAVWSIVGRTGSATHRATVEPD